MSDLNPVERPHFLKLCHLVLLRQFAKSATSLTPTRSVLAKDNGHDGDCCLHFTSALIPFFACDTYCLKLSFVLDDIEKGLLPRCCISKIIFKWMLDAGVQTPSPMTMTVNIAGITLCAFCWMIESRLKPLRIEQDVTLNHSWQKCIQYCRRQSRKSSETDHQYLFYPSIVYTVSIDTAEGCSVCLGKTRTAQWYRSSVAGDIVR